MEGERGRGRGKMGFDRGRDGLEGMVRVGLVEGLFCCFCALVKRRLEGKLNEKPNYTK